MQRRCCAAATSAPALLCHERRACLLFASSARPFLDASRSHAGVCVAAVPRGALRAPLRAPPHPAAPLRCFCIRLCALPGGHPARSGQRRGGLRRAERRPDVLAGRRGPHRPGAPQTQPRALVASRLADARCPAQVSRPDWLRNAAGVVDPAYWRGELCPTPTVDWCAQRQALPPRALTRPARRTPRRAGTWSA